MKRSITIMLAAAMLSASGCANQQPGNNAAPPQPEQMQTVHQPAIVLPENQDKPDEQDNSDNLDEPERSTDTEITFSVERKPDGSALARLIAPNNDRSLSQGPAVTLGDNWYHLVQQYSGEGRFTNALLSFHPENVQLETIWCDSITDQNNRWYNALVSGYPFLIQLDAKHLLFMESEITNEGGQFHLSSYNSETKSFERLREDFWPLSEKYDYIYLTRWNDDLQKLLLQSYRGNVWIFDLMGGQDEVHLQRFRVIPHSTTGAPSLFPSPNFERFVHDDESGTLTLYDAAGTALRGIEHPAEQYVPSEKIKWNPDSTAAWMEVAEVDDQRIKMIDIDFLSIAPQWIHFYDSDGRLLSVLAAEKDSGNSIDVAAWADSHNAVIKAYTAHSLGTYEGIEEQDISYYLYNIKTKKKKPLGEEEAEAYMNAAVRSRDEILHEAPPIKVELDSIIYGNVKR
ncbi:hypothetical protein EBB07_17885 [Paenibacillaceae bacterium]|nr:hypothetical protein EBB07_17885 [Paenibacillaceae bacterium]